MFMQIKLKQEIYNLVHTDDLRLMINLEIFYNKWELSYVIIPCIDKPNTNLNCEFVFSILFYNSIMNNI